MASKKKHWQRPLGVSRSDTRFSGSRNETLEGQGSIDYLLLIAGAVLVVTVVLLVLFTSVIPAAGQILSNNISQAGQAQTLPGNNPNNPPPAYSGPLVMDWSNVPALTYADFGIDNLNDPYSASPTKIISNIELVNNAPPGSSDITIEQFTPQFSFSYPGVVSNSLPTQIDSIIFSHGATSRAFSTIPFNLPVDISSNPLVLSPGDVWSVQIVFDLGVFPVENPYYYYPAAGSHTLKFLFSDSTNTVHRPDAWHQFLVYEKKIPDPLIPGSFTLDPFIQTCDGSQTTVGGTQPNIPVVTDRCLNTGSCSYVIDQGYSTAFSFPSISVNALLDDVRLFMTNQINQISGEGTPEDADDYSFVKNGFTCDDTIFDDVVDMGPTPGTVYASPSSGTGILPDVKSFGLNGMIVPGENEVFFTIVGDDLPNYSSDSDGFRIWQTGHVSGQSTPSPFLVVRYSVPQ